MEPNEILGKFPAGRLLDVATGRGGLLGHLLGNLQDICEIVAIDIDPSAAKRLEEAFPGKAIDFQAMDAANLSFADATFDTVSIGYSLHHLQQLPVSLGEMLRVLKPGGHFIVLEMYSDTEIESQVTHVLIHHWWAAVDTVLGVPHYPTFSRAQLCRLVESLGLTAMQMMDFNDTSYDAFDPETITQIEKTIDQYIHRAAGHPDLIERGEALRLRLKRTGFHGAPALLVVGQKPG